MKYKQPKQTFLIVFLLCLLILQFYLSTVKADSQIVTGSNFNLYFPATAKLAFQHCSSAYAVNPFIVTLTVNSGTLNGTDATLTMTGSSGTLKFLNFETTTVALTAVEEVEITVNGQSYSAPVSLTPDQDVTITWSYFEVPWLLPMMFIFGMIGLFSTVGGPIYAYLKIKNGEYYEGCRTGLILTVVGLALTMAWLW